jgi:hypothetical protein
VSTYDAAAEQSRVYQQRTVTSIRDQWQQLSCHMSHRTIRSDRRRLCRCLMQDDHLNNNMSGLTARTSTRGRNHSISLHTMTHEDAVVCLGSSCRSIHAETTVQSLDRAPLLHAIFSSYRNNHSCTVNALSSASTPSLATIILLQPIQNIWQCNGRSK